MKKLNHCKLNLLIIILIIFFQGCNNYNSDIVNEIQYLDQKQAFLVGLKYLKLEKNKYIFSMTEKEASLNNISQKDYSLMLSDVQKTNTLITIIKDKENISYFNPALYDNNINLNLSTRILGIEAPEMVAYIKTTEGNWGYASGFIPGNVSYVEVYCASVGFLQFFSVFVGGQLVNGVGFFGGWSTKINPEYSNTSVKCGFKTSHSSGGICNIIAHFNPTLIRP